MGRYDGILLVSDFDRTLTDESGNVPEENKKAIRAFMEEGGKFTVASGRSVPFFRKKVPLFECNAPVILFNGALCYDFETEQPVFGTPITGVEELLPVLMTRWPLKNIETQGIKGHTVYRIDDARVDFFRDLGVHAFYGQEEEAGPQYLLFVGGAFIRPDDPNLDFRMGTPEDDAMFDECNAWIEAQGPYFAIRSTRLNTEVMEKSASKGSAARKLANLLGCKTLICAGDAMNDLAMLQEADIAYTPEDGSEDIREILGDKLQIAAPCYQGTIADVIKRL